ncbi:MAG TPA: EthD domain-containing protein [Dehalococcoidia bacterium]|nr:EthD domain-containing protein [Dehalococcoidia bacterium]
MVKAVAIIKRRPDLTFQQFVDHWRNVHAPLALQIPGVIKYVQSPALQRPGAKSQPAVDGIAEIWFESIDTYRAGFATPAAEALLADEQNFIDLNNIIRTFVQEIDIV